MLGVGYVGLEEYGVLPIAFMHMSVFTRDKQGLTWQASRCTCPPCQQPNLTMHADRDGPFWLVPLMAHRPLILWGP